MTAVDAARGPATAEALVPHVAEGRSVLRALVHDRVAVTGAVILAVFSVAAVLAPLLAPHDPNAVDVARKLAGPSAEFPFGTDNLGRDLLSRLLYGARLSIGMAVVGATGIAVLGLVMGLLAGFFGGVLDTLISRVVDVLLAFPTFLLALAVTGILGPGLRNLTAAVILTWWAGYARIVRGAVLAEREKPYLEAARSIGASNWRTITRHLLPNIAAPVLVLTTLDSGAIMLGISALSFLGLGVGPPTAEWGAMISEGTAYVALAPHVMIVPGTAIFLVVMAFNLLGDGLRDSLDPRTRRSHP